MIRKGSLTYHLLFAAEKGLEIGITVFDLFSDPRLFVYRGGQTDIRKNNLYKSIRELKNKGFIESNKNGRKIILKLTEKGRQELILRKLLQDKKWDGKWRIVIFDIPEKHRRVRDIFRRQLKMWQFNQLQKSVWVGKKDLVKELTKFVKDLNISEWVKIFEATEIKFY